MSASTIRGERLREAHFRPEPRLAVGQALASAGIRAAMDISDGLVGDLAKLCEASEVGAVVRGYDIPASDVLRSRFPEEWLSLALTGGEDYELLFTGSEKNVSGVSEAVDIPVTIIGEIVEASRGVTVVDAGGRKIDDGRVAAGTISRPVRVAVVTGDFGTRWTG